MPIYEYNCDHCKTDFEFLVRGNQQPECPDCQGQDVQKLLSVAAAPKSSGSLPLRDAPESCSMPRCCGGGCSPDL
ncbi:MAG: zinc ribbon domain-containing protein [Mariniblastus sp.]|nr:zinc ribbon domain-containing protein [Mariniblastus sp.]